MQGAQFAVSEVEVVSATVDLDVVVSYRGGIASLQQQVCSHTVYLSGCAAFRLQCMSAGASHLLIAILKLLICWTCKHGAGFFALKRHRQRICWPAN